MVRDNNIIWSAYSVDSFFNLYQRVKTGMVQPLDPYIAASSVPGAKDFKDKYINKTVFDAGVLDGKFYHFPNKLNLTMVPHNVDYVKGAGFETIPGTWDEMRPFFRRIKEKYAKDDVIPLSINMDLWRSIGGIYCTFTSKPYNADGMVDIDSREWFAAMELIKSFYDDKLAEPALLGSPDEQTTWQKGKIAVIFNYPSWYHLANAAFPGKYWVANMPKPKSSDPGRTWVHVDGTYLIGNAPYPQETVDWMLSLLGPEGEISDVYTKGMISRSGSPMYRRHVEGAVVKENTEMPWLYSTYKMMEGSTVAPLSAFHFLLDQKLKKYLPGYFKGELSAQDAMGKVKAEVNQDRDKMLSGQG
jgi:maltose-binding protein MalE